MRDTAPGVTPGKAEREKVRSARIEAQTQGSYKYFALGSLFIVYTLAFVDRQIIVILGEDIKAELSLSDTQLGALTGFAFALFYVTLGIPVARLADIHNRITILSISLGLWSVMTAVCALATNFWHLALARFGVGVGEAGCNPPAYSVIADYFPPKSRSTALSVYVSAGTALGILVGFAIGGLVADAYGWRAAFLIVGLPGVLLAIFLKLALREPEREGRGGGEANPPGFTQTIAALLKMSSFICITLAVACNAFVIYAVLNWMPNLMIRVHGMPPSVIGLQLGLMFGVGMATGGIIVGWLSDRLAQKDARFYAWVPAAAVGLSPPFFFIAFLAETPGLVLAFAVLPILFLNCTAGPVLTVIMGLVETRARAVASSIFLLIVNVAGLGISPVAVGALSDLLAGTYGVRSLAIALSTVVWLNLLSAVFFLLASRSLRRDLMECE